MAHAIHGLLELIASLNSLVMLDVCPQHFTVQPESTHAGHGSLERLFQLGVTPPALGFIFHQASMFGFHWSQCRARFFRIATQRGDAFFNGLQRVVLFPSRGRGERLRLFFDAQFLHPRQLLLRLSQLWENLVDPGHRFGKLALRFVEICHCPLEARHGFPRQVRALCGSGFLASSLGQFRARFGITVFGEELFIAFGK